MARFKVAPETGVQFGADPYWGARNRARSAEFHWEELMRACYSMMGLQEKPNSVRILGWLKRIGLPTFGMGWRVELWYRMLIWEYGEWKLRIIEKAGHSQARTINTLLRVLPWSPRESHWVFKASRSGERAVFSRWLRLHGRDLSSAEFKDLLEFYAI